MSSQEAKRCPTCVFGSEFTGPEIVAFLEIAMRSARDRSLEGVTARFAQIVMAVRNA